MATAIIMPKAGVAMEEGTIIQWLKKPGEPVEAGEIILEIETDKVSMEVEAEVGGFFLGSLAEPGEVVPVTVPIGYIGKKGEAMPAETSHGAEAEAAGDASADISSADVSSAKAASAPTPETPSRDGNDPRVAASPAAARLSREHGIRLADIAAGSGTPIRAADVNQAVQAGGNTRSAPGRVSSLARQELEKAGHSGAGIDGSGSGGRVMRRDVSEQLPGLLSILEGLGGFVPPAQVPVNMEEGDSSEALTGIRKVTAQRMMTSQLTIPPTTLHREVSVGQLSNLRSSLKTDGISLSVNVLILKAVARALRSCPWMMVSMGDGRVIQRSRVNLGMAVATDRGLLVPVIHDADELSLVELAARSAELAGKAREGRLGMDEMSGGVFSVSNLGMYGITTFTPVVNPPEAAILGVGTIRKQLTRDNKGEIVDREIMDLSLTLDHRLIDGAQGALFLQELALLMEAPLKLLAGG
jgi:pyruvate dehydrogenase E2 component (dihydrolipoamide acetyltransferase)